MTRTIVQKYGGTSVGSVELIQRVADKVAAIRRQGDNIAVVVSAMGDHTDRLGRRQSGALFVNSSRR